MSAYNKPLTVIGCDWGTTNLRAYLFGPDGEVLCRRTESAGIMAIRNSSFEEVLEKFIGDWLNNSPDATVILSGMIGSRQGWKETPYLQCPANIHELQSSLTAIDLKRGRKIWITPGLSYRDGYGNPDVMRGEEVQILGALEITEITTGTVCLPGTHSKWATIKDGKVIEFRTYMTGEIFGLMKDNSILSYMLDSDSWKKQAFAEGIERANSPGGLLNHLFGIRSKSLFNELQEDSASSYLSGLLVGHEINSTDVNENSPEIFLIGDGKLVDLYATALSLKKYGVRRLPEDVTATGLFRIAQSQFI